MTRQRSSTEVVARLRGLGVALMVLLATLATTTEASAQESVRAEITVVHAIEAAGEIDPALADLPALRQAPFNAFRTMRVLSRPHHDLRVGRPVEVELPNGRRLRLTLQQITRNGRYRVRVEINRPERSDYLRLLTVVASPGDPFFVAGQGYSGGTLVIGIRLGVPAARPPG